MRTLPTSSRGRGCPGGELGVPAEKTETGATASSACALGPRAPPTPSSMPPPLELAPCRPERRRRPAPASALLVTAACVLASSEAKVCTGASTCLPPTATAAQGHAARRLRQRRPNRRPCNRHRPTSFSSRLPASLVAGGAHLCDGRRLPRPHLLLVLLRPLDPVASVLHHRRRRRPHPPCGGGQRGSGGPRGAGDVLLIVVPSGIVLPLGIALRSRLRGGAVTAARLVPADRGTAASTLLPC
ncbi:Os01g0740700 [Oryza sativa Japonica Group]|jgi:hypothetical protein|uniref:Os01g0740700 protein n=1 Tax=Oryza sativa subsp. japonica TaxID=39947 RepID=A0A0N7KDQ5_ORYSJ|nr:hypothetical protein EE612_005631 [Oryza sativa]BAS74273.1 Os01g0740700 [Oryza sativa Japonica Group]